MYAGRQRETGVSPISLQLAKVGGFGGKKTNMSAGGKRTGSGRKTKEPTSTINFRMKKSRILLLKELYPGISKEFKLWVDKLIENKSK